MDKQFKIILGAIIVCILLIILKVTIFDTLFKSNELIPGVTDDEIFTKIHYNSTLGQYILNDSFMDEISGVHIESRSEIYATNDTSGEDLFEECCNSLIGVGFEEDYTKEYPKEGRYTGVFKNDTRKRVFHIFEGNDVEEHTGYYLILIVYEGRK